MTPGYSLGNMIARLHDQAVSNSKPNLPDSTKRRCWYGNHSALITGGKYIGSKWACVKCKEIAK